MRVTGGERDLVVVVVVAYLKRAVLGETFALAAAADRAEGLSVPPKLLPSPHRLSARE